MQFTEREKKDIRRALENRAIDIADQARVFLSYETYDLGQYNKWMDEAYSLLTLARRFNEKED